MFRFQKKRAVILAVDGGGIKGIIPALVLEDLEKRLAARGITKPFCRLFDLMAGTSTGSIIVLGLAAPGPDGKTPAYRASDIRSIYETRGREIFPPARFNSIRAISQVWTEKYDHRPLDAILEHYFGKRTLRDALTNVLVTAFDTEHTRPFLFKNRPAGDAEPDFFMKDAARASSAAPTIFELPNVQAVDDPKLAYGLVDGGVFANNPSMCAFIEARKKYPRVKKFIILSLGTGRAQWGYPYSEVKDWGYIDWVRPSKGTPLFRMIMRGQSECVSYQLSRIREVEYIRINGLLGGSNELMDDAGEANIRELKKTAEQFIKDHDGEMDRMADILSGRR